MGGSCTKEQIMEWGLNGRANGLIKKREHERMKDYENVVKLLLLGTGESGKTTILRQMQNMYGQGMSEADLLAKKLNIFSNVVEGTQKVLEKLKNNDDEDFKAASHLLSDIEINYMDLRLKFTPELVEALLLLYQSEYFQKLLKAERNTLQIPSSYEYYMEKLKNFPQWGGDTWIPSVEDVLRVRVRTTGAYTISFDFRSVKILLTDVGGQFSERSHWMSLFQAIHSVIFVASLVDYKLVCFEDEKTNRLVDSINEWEKICKLCKKPDDNDIASEPNLLFVNSAVVLFLNKSDLLKEDLENNKKDGGIRISESVRQRLDAPKIPCYQENLTFDENFQNVVLWYQELYESRMRKQKTDIYVFETNALDTQIMQKVMAAIHAQVLINIFNFDNSL